MKKFTAITSVPTPFVRANIDTDIIIPADYLKTVTRFGLGEHAFKSVRYDEQGKLTGEAVFYQKRFKDSEILVAGKNFGCGSSREHAPWAIADLGYRCIIAPSFADIFNSNCFKNGILAIQLPQEAIDALALDGEEGAEITVNLDKQIITRGNKQSFEFEYNPLQKDMLLDGMDEIAQTLASSVAISSFETSQKAAMPWLYKD